MQLVNVVAGNVVVHYRKKKEKLTKFCQHFVKIPTILGLKFIIFSDFAEPGGYGASAVNVTWLSANGFILVHLSSFSFHICFIQDILPFYRWKSIFYLFYVQHTAIMPQIDNNVDNICDTVIMKVVIICMKSSLKRTKDW